MFSTTYIIDKNDTTNAYLYAPIKIRIWADEISFCVYSFCYLTKQTSEVCENSFSKIEFFFSKAPFTGSTKVAARLLASDNVSLISKHFSGKFCIFPSMRRFLEMNNARQKPFVFYVKVKLSR